MDTPDQPTDQSDPNAPDSTPSLAPSPPASTSDAAPPATVPPPPGAAPTPYGSPPIGPPPYGPGSVPPPPYGGHPGAFAPPPHHPPPKPPPAKKTNVGLVVALLVGVPTLFFCGLIGSVTLLGKNATTKFSSVSASIDSDQGSAFGSMRNTTTTRRATTTTQPTATTTQAPTTTTTEPPTTLPPTTTPPPTTPRTVAPPTTAARTLTPKEQYLVTVRRLITPDATSTQAADLADTTCTAVRDVGAEPMIDQLSTRGTGPWAHLTRSEIADLIYQAVAGFCPDAG